jgi:hypothetical protein
MSLSPKLVVPATASLRGVPGGSSTISDEDRNPGTGQVPWSVRSLTNWLTVSPSTGTSTSAASASFGLTAWASGLVPGTYTGTVRVTSETTHLMMFLDVAVTFTVVTQVSRIPDVDGDGVRDTTMALSRFLLGMTAMPDQGGWIDVHAGSAAHFNGAAWLRNPWMAYNAAGGEIYPAVGDVDGDGLDEVVLGFGPAGHGWFVVLDDDLHDYSVLGWIQLDWPTYNSGSPVLYPAVGDIDGDGRAEIVIGLGQGSNGWVRIYDDASTGFAPAAWRRVAWDSYDMANGETHPAIGDLDGDGKAEILLGLGQGGGGFVEIVTSGAGDYSLLTWIRSTYSDYNAAEGIVWPAAGDLDNDGRAEIVLGLGHGGHGWAEVRDDAVGGYRSLRWIGLGWPAYNDAVGEVHPAIGNIDGDPGAEIVIGLGAFAGNGGWFLICDDGATGNASLGWRRINWGEVATRGLGTFPAVGKLR